MGDFKVEKVVVVPGYSAKQTKRKKSLARVAMAILTGLIIGSTEGCGGITGGVPFIASINEWKTSILLIESIAYTNLFISGKTNTLFPALVFYVPEYSDRKFGLSNDTNNHYLSDYSNFNTINIVPYQLISDSGSNAIYECNYYIYISQAFSYYSHWQIGLATIGKGGTNANLEDDTSVTNTILGGEMFPSGTNSYTNIYQVQGFFTNNIFIRKIKWNYNDTHIFTNKVIAFKNYIVKP